MRVPLLSPAVLLLLVNVAHSATAIESDQPIIDFPKSGLTQSDSSKGNSVPQNVLPKSDAPQRDSSKSDAPKGDFPVTDKTTSLHKSDSLQDITAKADDLAQGVPPKSDPPLNNTAKQDFILIITDKRHTEGDPIHEASISGRFPESNTATVKALQQRLLEEQAKTLDFRNQSSYLFKELHARKSQVLKTQEQSLDMVAKMNDVNRKLLETHVQLENVRKQVKKCQGKLSGKELFRLANIEANRLVKEEREPIVNYNHRNRFLKLLRELRRKIKEEIDKISVLVVETTTTLRPSDRIFPTLPWL
uniref:Accessory gland-specific peptide 26Aa n=1 Tax=Drosophila rhopaloa TaxID=1041015 RepID=A0A6P4F337_DRORH